MSNNRTEQQALISALAPTVDLVELQAAIVQAGYVFKKDVITTVAASTGLATADFSTNDQIIVTTTANVNITVTGLEDGQVAKLVVNKSAANTISFAGITGTIDGQVVGKTSVSYSFWSANGNIYGVQINRQGNGSFAFGELSNITNVTVAGVENLDFVINDNIVNISGEVELLTTATLKTIGFNVASSEMGQFKQQTPRVYTGSCKVYNTNTGSYYNCSFTLFNSSGNYSFRFVRNDADFPNTGIIADGITVYFNASIQIV